MFGFRHHAAAPQEEVGEHGVDHPKSEDTKSIVTERHLGACRDVKQVKWRHSCGCVNSNSSPLKGFKAFDDVFDVKPEKMHLNRTERQQPMMKSIFAILITSKPTQGALM